MVRAVAIDQAYARLRRTESTAYGHGTAALRDDRSTTPRPLGGAPTRVRHSELGETGSAGEDTHGRTAGGRTEVTRRGAFRVLTSGLDVEMGTRSLRAAGAQYASCQGLPSFGVGGRTAAAGSEIIDKCSPFSSGEVEWSAAGYRSSGRGSILFCFRGKSCTHSKTCKYILCGRYSWPYMTADQVRAILRLYSRRARSIVGTLLARSCT